MEDIKSFADFMKEGLNESRIADAILDAIESWYKAKSASDGAASLKKIVSLSGVEEEVAKKILNRTKDADDAMDKLLKMSESVNEAASTDLVKLFKSIIGVDLLKNSDNDQVFYKQGPVISLSKFDKFLKASGLQDLSFHFYDGVVTVSFQKK